MSRPVLFVLNVPGFLPMHGDTKWWLPIFPSDQGQRQIKVSIYFCHAWLLYLVRFNGLQVQCPPGELNQAHLKYLKETRCYLEWTQVWYSSALHLGTRHCSYTPDHCSFCWRPWWRCITSLKLAQSSLPACLLSTRPTSTCLCVSVCRPVLCVCDCVCQAHVFKQEGFCNRSRRY